MNAIILRKALRLLGVKKGYEDKAIKIFSRHLNISLYAPDQINLYDALITVGPVGRLILRAVALTISDLKQIRKDNRKFRRKSKKHN